MAILAALVAGIALGWLLSRGSRHRSSSPLGLRRLQLLRWIEDSPGGWLVLDPSDHVHLINPRAERLLHCQGVTPPHPETLGSGLPLPSRWIAVIHNARSRGRLQRRQWQLRDQELEAYALAGEAGWVAVVLHSRRSLEAQLEQQERWVSDVAHELKTPLTALLLVGDSLAARANTHGRAGGTVATGIVRLQRLVGDLRNLSRLENTLPGERSPRGRWICAIWWSRYGRTAAPGRGRAIRLSWRPSPWWSDRAMAPGFIGPCSICSTMRCDYSPDGGTGEVTVRPVTKLVSADGPGRGNRPRGGDLERLFERFYRGDPSRARSDRWRQRAWALHRAADRHHPRGSCPGQQPSRGRGAD